MTSLQNHRGGASLIDRLHRLLVIPLLGILMTDPGEPLCVFPRSWRGTWFESDFGDVIVGQSNISHKGTCVHADRGFYLIDNKQLDCLMCLLIEQRHTNVLQYRQSFCVRRDATQKACSNVNANTVQHTLIRDATAGGSPVHCPLRDAYHFTYVNNSGGLCAYPTSYAKPCANPSRFRLHFKACPTAAYTYERELDLRCAAVWNDGSDAYFVARLSTTVSGHGPGGAMTSHGSDGGDLFRCFMYKVYGTVVYASMSADSSCRGLLTPRDGPTVLELTQDVFGWPKSQCTFPAWITRSSWRDLTGRHLYAANDMGDVIDVAYRAALTSPDEVNKALRCYRVLARNTTAGHVTVVAFVVLGCVAKYQCVKFVKRKDTVIEVHKGPYVDRSDEFCYEADMLDSNKRILTADGHAHTFRSTPTCHAHAVRATCPFQGQRRVRTFFGDGRDGVGHVACDVYFRSGCNGSSSLDVISTCSSVPESVIETRCNSELKKAWKMVDDGIQDVFVPYCDEDGYYLPMQTYYYSEDVDGFCTDKYGNQLSDAGDRRVLVCPPSVLTKCQTERLEAEERAETNIGVYIPQCSVNGDYKPLQRSASTGSSWCVDKDGKVLDVPISICQRVD